MKIKDIGRVVTGKTPTTENSRYFDGNYMFITPVDIAKGFVLTSSERTLTEEGYLSISSNTLHGTSVLVGCIGSDMGNVAIVEKDCATNQQINAITDITCHVNPYYVYYYLSMRKSYLRKLAGVTTTPILPKSTFEEIDIVLPLKTVQDKVVNILYTLDDKIYHNTLICAELEDMAKTIYDYWFTQFDFPNEEGKPYRSSGGEMVWNDQLKREIPSGWKIDNIQNTCSVIDCLHSQKPEQLYAAESYYLLQLENLVDLGLIDLHSKYYVSKDMYELWTSRIQVEDGDLVVTNAGRVGAVSRIPQHVIAGIGRNMTAIRPNTIPPFFLYYFFKSPDFYVQMRANTDSGAFFGSLNVRGIKQLLLTVPPASSDILKRFDSLVEPMRRKIESLQLENEELTKLRDWLLPMLMNGQAAVE